MLDKEILSQINNYKNAEKDAYFLEELAQVESENNEAELYERFYTDLEFGTGGIRGIIEAGTNRLNTLIVQRVADGWARYLVSQFPNEQVKVVIAYDSRRFSDVFTEVVSEVLCSYNIRVYRYPSPRPTPQLSFTIRALQAHSGLVITASHNPPKYNGLKIYWNDGAQIITPHDQGIMEQIEESKTKNSFPSMMLDDAKSQGLYEILGKEYDEKFRDYAKSVLVNRDVFTTDIDFKVVYTPLHGTGTFHIDVLLQELGIDGVIEPSQKEPNGEFPTVKFPNPEDPAALINAIETAKKQGAHLVVATDPDADRVGIAENIDGNFICLTGNQIGVLLLDYVLLARKNTNTLLPQSVFINTIVTTTLQEKIASKAGVETLKTFTGFKHIAAAMATVEKEKRNYVFSCEESYGYLPSMEVRDKDGISIAILCIEMAKYYATQGKSLSDRLQEIYEIYGYHEEQTVNIVLEGSTGKEKIAKIMDTLRNNPPVNIGTEKVSTVHDYHEKTIKNAKGEIIDTIEGFADSSNVLIFTTESGNQLCMRPSGTEPKIKFYFLYSSPQGIAVEEGKVRVQSEIKAGEQTLQEWLV